MSAPGDPVRVAIVGGGPKGLYALERLSARTAGREARMEVIVFEPGEHLGCGPHYAPRSPAYLRMNFAAEQVCMWPRSAGSQRFADWDGQSANGEDRYPPRGEVGKYLIDGFAKVEAGLPPGVRIHHLRECAEWVKPAGSGWVVGGRERRAVADEVLLASGHEARSAGSLGASGWSHRARLIPSVFPVGRDLAGLEGATVAVRGMALTMIDAALAMTEGVGGRFRPNQDGGLRYEPSGREPAKILPYSRTGRLMLVKTGPAWARQRGLDPAEETGGLRANGGAIGVASHVVPALERVAADALARLGIARPDSLRTAAAALRRGEELAVPWPLEELERSLAIARGAAAPNGMWALGYAWRTMYPAVVKELSGGALDSAEWPAFRSLARELERIAFGPPPLNGAKISALARHGLLDLSLSRGHLTESQGGTDLADGARRERVDTVVDAVLPGPGVSRTSQPLYESLLADGLVRVPPGRRGLELSPDVVCVGSDGHPTRGLAAIGRATEDWVIGNDTLSRELHDEPDRWAKRVVERATG